MRFRYLGVLLGAMVGSASSAVAEIEVSLYTGLQSAPASDVSVRGDPIIPDSDFSQSWEGKPFEWPLYAGFRITRWTSDTVGFGLDYAHNKTYPKDDELPSGFRALEFTDGLNTWTINAYRRWPALVGNSTPYIGAGAGLSVPGVEVTYGSSRTYEYQVTGPAVTWLAGLSTPLQDQWSMFFEYKGTYTENEVDLETGGRLSSDIVTHALNVGVGFSF